MGLPDCGHVHGHLYFGFESINREQLRIPVGSATTTGLVFEEGSRRVHLCLRPRDGAGKSAYVHSNVSA